MSSPALLDRGTVSLSASADAGHRRSAFERRLAGGGGWTTIVTANGAPWSTSFDTTTAPDGDYELRAIATDAGGNSGTSTAVTTKVDNTNLSGSLTAPGTERPGRPRRLGLGMRATAALVSHPSPSSTARAAGAAGRHRLGLVGALSGDVGHDCADEGAHDLQAVVTDAAGNQFTTGVVKVG